MKDEELVLYFNEHRLKKLEEYLLKDGSSAEHELQKLLCGLYESTVPERERMEIEALIELETENESAAREAARRFAVVHLHEGDDDVFFTTETCDDFYSISSRYRTRMKADIGEYTLDSIAQSSFGGCQEINGMTFSVLCDAMPNDRRITALVEFDFDNDTVSVCDSSDNAWRAYSLNNVSSAVLKAERKSGLSLETRREVFVAALEDKEIAFDTDEDETPVASLQPSI